MSNCTYSALVVDVYAGILQQLSHSARLSKSGSIVESLIVVTLQRVGVSLRYSEYVNTSHPERSHHTMCEVTDVGYTH
jgi:hypothetical protein